MCDILYERALKITEATYGVDHPVAYYSRTFSKDEKNYSVTGQECLAVIKSVKHFPPYLYGTHFKVITGHSSLKWLII